MMIMRKMPRKQNVGTPSQFREMTRTAASLHFSTHVPGLYISYFSTGACDYACLQILLVCTISTILHLVTLTWTQVSTLLDCANYMCLVHTSHLLVTVFFPNMYLLLQLSFFAQAYLSIFLLIFCLCSSIIQSILILTKILSNAPVASSQSQGRASVCAPLSQSDFVFAAKLFSWRSMSTRSSFLGSLPFESYCPRQWTWDMVDLQVCWQEVSYWSWALPHIFRFWLADFPTVFF